MSFVPALEQRYEFTEDRLVFEDGTVYTLAEATFMAKDRLSAEDIQAIHLVKRLFGGEIVGATHVDHEKKTVTDTVIDAVQENLPLGFEENVKRDLDEMGKSFGDLPMIGGSDE